MLDLMGIITTRQGPTWQIVRTADATGVLNLDNLCATKNLFVSWDSTSVAAYNMDSLTPLPGVHVTVHPIIGVAALGGDDRVAVLSGTELQILNWTGEGMTVDTFDLDARARGLWVGNGFIVITFGGDHPSGASHIQLRRARSPHVVLATVAMARDPDKVYAYTAMADPKGRVFAGVVRTTDYIDGHRKGLYMRVLTSASSVYADIKVPSTILSFALVGSVMHVCVKQGRRNNDDVCGVLTFDV